MSDALDKLALSEWKALRWLVERGGNGVTMRRNGVLARGDVAPDPGPWKRLEDVGLICRKGGRVEVTSAGYAAEVESDSRTKRLRAVVTARRIARLKAGAEL